MILMVICTFYFYILIIQINTTIGNVYTPYTKTLIELVNQLILFRNLHFKVV